MLGVDGDVVPRVFFGITALLLSQATFWRVSRRRRPYVVVITGGPCAGKSTIMKSLKVAMDEANVYSYTVPECPTMLIINGANYPGESNVERLLTFETQMLNLQLVMENSFINIADTYNRPSIVFCDRGTCDISAYMPRNCWERVLSLSGYTEYDLLSRYDAVVHLTTAAEGAEKYYTSANNNARTETVEEAREMDRKSRDSWKKHQNRIIIDNGAEGMQGKIDEAISLIVESIQRHILSDKFPGDASISSPRSSQLLSP